MAQREGTLKMKEELLACREQGMTAAEIAAKYQVSLSTYYTIARKLAEELGISYEDNFLNYPHSPHSGYEFYMRPVPLVDPTEVHQHFDRVFDELTELQGAIDAHLATDPVADMMPEEAQP